jgi:hypothetical protein
LEDRVARGQRDALLASIAATITDYRQGEIPTLDADHVDRWISQFDRPVQEPMLVELDHVLKKTYVTKAQVEKFMAALLTASKLAGENPCEFWQKANFLNIQGAGNSQREMLELFEVVLRRTCGVTLNDCGSNDGPYIYLDDAIFTGGRIRNDLLGWIQSSAPSAAKVHVVVIAFHRGGQWFAKTAIGKGAKAAGKTIDISWWRVFEIEDRKAYIAESDVLRPSSVPDDAATQEYAQSLSHAPVLRPGNSLGGNGFFASAAGRHLLEHELLKAGVYIRSVCPYLNVYQRPLGNMVLETLGFGALVVTFRNCPNNCPLAFWAGDPWYPLFPRKTN